jgi:hypothetical protein
MGFATLVAWGGWGFVVWSVDPKETGVLGLILFYITLLSALIGTLTVFGVWYRVRRAKMASIVSREVRISVRHAVMLSCVAVVSLALAAKDLLAWWNTLGMFVLVGVIEYIFLLVQDSRRT